MAQAEERDTFKSERLLRQQAAVDAQAERAKFALIFLNEGAWSISEMCRTLKVSRQGYHAWKRRPPSAHDLRDSELASKISGIYDEGSREIYGAPKAFAELGRAGERTSRKRVARLMREGGLVGTTRGCARRPKGACRRTRRCSPLLCVELSPHPLEPRNLRDGQTRPQQITPVSQPRDDFSLDGFSQKAGDGVLFWRQP